MTKTLMDAMRSSYLYPQDKSETCSHCLDHQAVHIEAEGAKCPYCLEVDLADIVGDELADQYHQSLSDNFEAVSEINKLQE